MSVMHKLAHVYTSISIHSNIEIDFDIKANIKTQSMLFIMAAVTRKLCLLFKLSFLAKYPKQLQLNLI